MTKKKSIRLDYTYCKYVIKQRFDKIHERYLVEVVCLTLFLILPVFTHSPLFFLSLTLFFQFFFLFSLHQSSDYPYTFRFSLMHLLLHLFCLLSLFNCIHLLLTSKRSTLENRERFVELFLYSLF